MSLSPYFKPSVLNGGLYGSTRGLEGMFIDGMEDNHQDAFDKRVTGTATRNKITQWISNAKTVSEMLTNALGTRSPYYTIGEIQGTRLGEFTARYMQDSLGNMVRAITSVYDVLTEQGQQGVIIDGFGEVSGTIDVEFSKNPVIFMSNSITDNRIRTPNTVTMTVYVSNYYNDDGLGAVTDYLTSFDPTGIAKEAINILAHDGNTRAQQALYNLRRIQERGLPFRLYTPHGVYENMAIKTLKPKTTAENVDMLECAITFQELIMYQPYYDPSNGSPKSPIRTNILDDQDSSTLSILNGEVGKKMAKFSKLWGGK